MKKSEPSPKATDVRRIRDGVEGELGGLRTRTIGRRPRGHVVGRGIGEAPSESFAARPHGHVVGRGIGVAPSSASGGRTMGHPVSEQTAEPSTGRAGRKAA